MDKTHLPQVEGTGKSLYLLDPNVQEAVTLKTRLHEDSIEAPLPPRLGKWILVVGW